jgi:predicted mannosyl-3-phosphoglycerate phosphatase (HAD superfamily)
MKQAIDTFTADMWADGTSSSGYATGVPVRDSLTEKVISDKFKYRFYIRTNDGATTEWTGLTRKRARDMHAYTEQSQPSNVTAFGWELTQ